MKKRLTSPNLPILQRNLNAKLKRRKSINKKSRNYPSSTLTHSILKDYFSSHCLTHRSKAFYNHNFAFNSNDKMKNHTNEASGSDTTNLNINKFKKLNIKSVQATRSSQKNRTNIRLNNSPRDNINDDDPFMKHLHRIRSPNNNTLNTRNLLYLSNEYKTSGLYTFRLPPSNVMNIVNNLHTDSANPEGGSNKNVEINFNKYEIKILSNKPTSAHSIRIKRKIQQSVVQKDKIHNDNKVEVLYYKDSEKDNSRQIFNNYKKINENNQKDIETDRLIKRERKKAQTSMIIKTSFTDCETNDGYLCLKQPMLKIVNESNIPKGNPDNAKSEAFAIVNRPMSKMINKSNITQLKANDEPSDTLKCLQQPIEKTVDVPKANPDNSSTNRLICLKQPMKTIVNENNIAHAKSNNETKDAFECLAQHKGSIINEDNISKTEPDNDTQKKEMILAENKEKENIEPNINTNTNTNMLTNNKLPADSITHNNTIDNNGLTSIFLRNLKIMSNQCEIAVYGNGNITKKDDPVENSLFIKIINERNSQDNSNENNSYDLSELILGNKHNVHPLQLRNREYDKKKIKRSEKSLNNSRSIKREGKKEKDNCSNISIIKHKKTNEKGQPECGNILDSSTFSDDSTKKTKTNKSFKKLFNSSFIKQRNKTVEVNQSEFAQVDQVNAMSSTLNSTSVHLKQKEVLSSFCSTKKTSSLVLTSKKKLIQENSMAQFRLQKHLQPKKNKRFLKQLSKISENGKCYLSLTQQKAKLLKSSSLSIPINKLAKANMGIHTLYRQASYTPPSRSYQDSVMVEKKKSVIKEIDQSSQSSIKISSSFSSVKDKSDEDIELRKFKKGSLISKSTNSINFFDLRTNSVRIATDISKCGIENSFCQPFIKKQANDIEAEQNDIEAMAVEEKNDLLSKIMLCIDIKCDRMEEGRHGTVTKYRTKTLLQLETQKRIELKDFMPFLDDFDEKISHKELDIIKEYEFCQDIYDSYAFTHQTLLSPLGEKYFQFNILYQIHKEKYLDQEIGNQEGSFIINFSKKRKILKRQVASVNSVNSEISRRKRQYNNMLHKKSKIKTLNGVNAAFCFQFIKNDDIYFEDGDKDDEVIKMKIMKFRNEKVDNKSPIKKKESNINILLNNKKRTQGIRNSTRIHFPNQKSIDNSPLLNLKRKDSILQMPFYLKQFDAKENKDTEIDNYEKEINKNLTSRLSLARKKKEDLYIKPNAKAKAKNQKEMKEREKKMHKSPSNIADKMLIFNKESVMSQTLEIKSKILTKMNNFGDSLIFYIKDGNYQNFKDIFQKYKVDTEIKDSNGNTFLNIAVQCDCLRITKFLIDNGANVDAQNDRLNTPLHYALSFQNFAIADLLIKSGANELLTNKFGLNPWQCINTASTNI